MYSSNEIIRKELWGNGPVPGEFYNFTGGRGNRIDDWSTTGEFGAQRISTPITTGTSVVGIKCTEGVLLAADNLVSYGSLACFQDVPRVFKVNDTTILGAAGDFADFQSIHRSINQMIIEDECHQDGNKMKPKSLHQWLTRVFYYRRNNMDPLWLNMIIGGMENGVPFLGNNDLRGLSFVDDAVASGLGKHLALPLLREEISKKGKLSLSEGMALVRKCMEVLYYRDCRAMSSYSIAVCTKDGSEVQGPFKINQNWEVAPMVTGY